MQQRRGVHEVEDEGYPTKATAPRALEQARERERGRRGREDQSRTRDMGLSANCLAGPRLSSNPLHGLCYSAALCYSTSYTLLAPYTP